MVPSLFCMAAGLAALGIAATSVNADHLPRFVVTELPLMADDAGAVTDASSLTEQGQVGGIAGSHHFQGATHGFRWVEGEISIAGEDFANPYRAFMNESGVVAAQNFDSIYREVPGEPAHAVWNNGSLHGLSDSGTILGRFFDDTSGHHQHVFVIPLDGFFTDIGHLGAGDTSANDINGNDEVVGWSRVGNHMRAFVWRQDENGGAMTELGTLGGESSEAIAINDDGVIVGHAATKNGESHTFRWTAESGMQDILPHITYSSPSIINDNGVVAGTYYDEFFMTHIFRYSDEHGFEHISPPAGVEDFTAFNGPIDMNSAGHIIGYGLTQGCFLSSWYWSPETGTVALTELVGDNIGFIVSEAVAMNDAGQILVRGFKEENSWPLRSALLTPAAAEDLDADGSVNVFDLLELLAAWGSCEAHCTPDIDRNGDVNVFDLLALLAAWG